MFHRLKGNVEENMYANKRQLFNDFHQYGAQYYLIPHKKIRFDCKYYIFELVWWIYLRRDKGPRERERQWENKFKTISEKIWQSLLTLRALRTLKVQRKGFFIFFLFHGKFRYLFDWVTRREEGFWSDIESNLSSWFRIFLICE